jgi:hypothetical protein
MTPTIATALVNAVSALWQVKKPTFTHKTFALDDRCRAGFLPFYIMSQTRRVKPAAIFSKINRLPSDEKSTI